MSRNMLTWLFHLLIKSSRAGSCLEILALSPNLKRKCYFHLLKPVWSKITYSTTGSQQQWRLEFIQTILFIYQLLIFFSFFINVRELSQLSWKWEFQKYAKKWQFFFRKHLCHFFFVSSHSKQFWKVTLTIFFLLHLWITKTTIETRL